MSRVGMGEVPHRTAPASGGVAAASLGASLTAAQLLGSFPFDDCEFPVNANTSPYFLSTSGGGASLATYTGSDMATRPGQSEYTTGSTTTGRTGDRTHTQCFCFGGGIARYRRALRFPTLSTAGERYAVIAGFCSGNTAIDQTNGAFFEYDEGGVATGGSASPNWKCVTADAGARTRTTTTVAVSAASFQHLYVEVNAAGTSAAFYIDGVLVATHVTNIPTANSRRVGALFHVIKSVGTGVMSALVDFFGHHVSCPAR